MSAVRYAQNVIKKLSFVERDQVPHFVASTSEWAKFQADPATYFARARENVAAELWRAMGEPAPHEADLSQPPIPELAGKVPVVLYFSNRADADEFAAVVKAEMQCPVEVRL